MVFHVAKWGCDRNSGAESAPFLTISKAAAIAQPGDTVCVHVGVYREWVNPANGGTADVEVYDDEIVIILSDKGPGIPNIELAMQEGYSTARDNIRNLGFGAGMGLPNMKKYTDSMEIDTRIGEGTTITMRVSL